MSFSMWTKRPDFPHRSAEGQSYRADADAPFEIPRPSHAHLMHSLTRNCVIAMLVLGSIIGCGLLTTISLCPLPDGQISRGSISTSFEVDFSNLCPGGGAPAAQSDAFRGFELYYKIYDISEEQNVGIEADENAVLDSDNEALATLDRRGFRRLRWDASVGERQVPLVDLRDFSADSGDDTVDVLLDFSGVGDEQANGPFVEWVNLAGETVRRTLLRNLGNGDDEFTADSEDYSSGQADTHGVGSYDAIENLRVMVFMLTYGISEDLSRLYSFEARQLSDPTFDIF